MEHRLVIVGSLHENVELVKEAKKRGYYTIVCDGYKDGPGKQFADKAYDIDVRNVDAFSKMCIDEKADGIIGSFSDLVFEQITKIAEKAGLKWYATTEMLKYYRNKYEQKKLLEDVGVRVQKCVKVYGTKDLEKVKMLSFPVVVKPATGWGSKGIVVLKTVDDIKNYAFENNTEYVIEEFCSAYEYNCIAFVVNGTVCILGIADREKTFIDDNSVPLLNRVVYPSTVMDKIFDMTNKTLQRFVNKTGQKSGPLSMQFFYDDDNEEVIVCEIAGRVLAHEHKLIKDCGGSDVNKLLLDTVYCSDEEVLRNIKPMEKGKYACGLYMMCKRNELIKDASKAYELFNNISEENKIIFCQSGDRFDYSFPYFARIYLQSESRSDLTQRSEYYFDNFFVVGEENENIAVLHKIERR
ncbi:MAG: ATP-grasp domain-containing protein [Eubacterium sp.]|nr:ATP-grasp domain-containing protein [Eubacterium sp.]